MNITEREIELYTSYVTGRENLGRERERTKERKR